MRVIIVGDAKPSEFCIIVGVCFAKSDEEHRSGRVPIVSYYIQIHLFIYVYICVCVYTHMYINKSGSATCWEHTALPVSASPVVRGLYPVDVFVILFTPVSKHSVHLTGA